MRIVIVDPSRVMLKIMSIMLAVTDYEVTAHCDARDALAQIRADTSIGVLITSLEPHGLTGLELCRAARRLAGARRTLHIMVMSSTAERRTLIEALDSGADDFIGKPPAREELLARLRVAERVTAMHRDLIRLATIDGLTGVLNRRAFFEAAMALDREPPEAAVALFDIDRFKSINDVYGHAAGDRVLSAVAGAAAADAAVLGRIGGEEFALLFPGATTAAALAACEAMRAGIQALRFPEIDPALVVTCSFGADAWAPDETIDDALKRSDVALYAAKAGGRNRVVAADATLSPLPAARSAKARRRPRAPKAAE